MDTEMIETVDLPLEEELDFHYLLTLMGPLYDVPNYSWLPELFSIIGHERLILLSKYAGGETITIPTLDELSEAVEAMQLYYDIFIKKSKTFDSIPKKHKDLVERIRGKLNA